MKQKYSKKSDNLKKIALERVVELFRQAELRFSKNSLLSDRYVEIARKIAMKYKVKMPRELKRKFCKSCHRYLVPGNNCRVRLTQHKVVCYCFSCRNHMRFPYK